MPSTPLYIHHLRQGIAALEALEVEYSDRRTLQEACGVSKWTAWRIMKRCGAQEGPGGSLVCQRASLIARLKEIEEDPGLAPEIRRRERVEDYLAGLAKYVSSKNKKIAKDAEAAGMLASRLPSLPLGVDLRPGQLHIAFSGTQDFLQKFGSVVFALQNDFETIQALLNSATQAVDPADPSGHA